MVIFWDPVSFSILLLLATLPELYFLTFFQKHLISPLASFDASASARKVFFHSSALDSEHIWTSLGTFSWAHEQLLSEACYNCIKENMLREILCMVPQGNHSSQAQEKHGISFALEYTYIYTFY